MCSQSQVLLEVQKDVAIISLNRPERLNAGVPGH